MLKRLTPLGNSLALVIDKPTRRLLGLSPNARVRVITDGRRLVVEPVRDDEVDPTLEPHVRRVGGNRAAGKGAMEQGAGGAGAKFEEERPAAERSSAVRGPQHKTDLELFLNAGRVLDALMDEHGLTTDVFTKLQRLYPRPRVYAGWLSFARASSVDAEHRQVIRRLDRCLQRRKEGMSWDDVLAELAAEVAGSRSES